LIQQISALSITHSLKFDILILDDESPDGTGAILDEISKATPNLHIIHRKVRNGIGGAHRDGISWAYEKGYKTLVTMDADFTHPPARIPELLNNTFRYEVVVGSRYMEEKSLKGWNFLRKTLTWTAHFLTTVLLGLKYDSTGAFRLYRIDRIPQATFELVRSNGYSFFFESLYILHVSHYAIHEIPIALPPRTYGSSKMSYREAFKSVKMLFGIYFRGREIKSLSLLAKSEINETKQESRHSYESK
jgi:dolichol-phosphate mannosyltransferase